MQSEKRSGTPTHMDEPAKISLQLSVQHSGKALASGHEALGSVSSTTGTGLLTHTS